MSDVMTYGAELELADLDRSTTLPEGCGWDTKDFSMVNSNGIAVDPTGRLYEFGGEVQTRPTTTIADQVACFREVLYLLPNATVNYRSNLHIHVRIPDLKHDLFRLKSLQTYIHRTLPSVLPILEPIPKPLPVDYPDHEGFNGALARYRRRRKSHQTFLPELRVRKQLEAQSVDEFFASEVPSDGKTGSPLWHAQPRCAVNLRQLLQTDTIEFRHFPGTTRPSQFEAALAWVRWFICCAWPENLPAEEVARQAALNAPHMPRFRPYIHKLELRYLRTTHDGSILKKDLPAAIEAVLAEIDEETLL